MDIGHTFGNALGGAVGGAVAGALIGVAMHKKLTLDKKLVVAGAGAFAGVAIIGSLLGRDIPFVPKTSKIGVAGPMPYRLSAVQEAAAQGAYGPWYAPNYYW